MENTFMDVLSGSICYFRHFSIFDITSTNTRIKQTTVNTIYTALNQHFKKIYFEDKPENCTTLQDLSIATNFLHPDGLPFLPKRAIIEDLSLSHDILPIDDGTIMITLFPEIGTASIGINLHFESCTTDQTVFLRQCIGNGHPFHVTFVDGTTKDMSIKDIFQYVISLIPIQLDSVHEASVLEINQFGESSIELRTLVEQEAKRVYGLLAGDEGWRFTPKSLALSRIQYNWGSRNFVEFITFGTTFLLFNLYSSFAGSTYEIGQKSYSEEYYGSMNPYFLLKSKFAGINHGILFSVETVLAIKTLTKYILDRQTFFNANKLESFNTSIKRTKEYRKDLMLTLNKLEHIGISELGELENLVLRSQNIDPVIEKIKYLLEMLDADLNLMYSQQTNRMVNLLTVLGLVFAGVSMALDLMGAFKG